MNKEGYGIVYATINKSQSEIFKKILQAFTSEHKLDHLMADVIQTS